MKTPSEYLGPRRSLLLVCFVVAAILIFQAIRIWVADYRVHSSRIDQMERGAALEPENAGLWDASAAPERQAMENGFRPFRCIKCNARFYGPRRSDGPASQDFRVA